MIALCWSPALWLLPNVDGIIGFQPPRHLHWVVYQPKGLLQGRTAMGGGAYLTADPISSNNRNVQRQKRDKLPQKNQQIIIPLVIIDLKDWFLNYETLDVKWNNYIYFKVFFLSFSAKCLLNGDISCRVSKLWCHLCASTGKPLDTKRSSRVTKRRSSTKAFHSRGLLVDHSLYETE